MMSETSENTIFVQLYLTLCYLLPTLMYECVPFVRTVWPHYPALKYLARHLRIGQTDRASSVFLDVKTSYFFFILSACVVIRLLFNGLLALLFCLFYIIRGLDKFLHRMSWPVVTKIGSVMRTRKLHATHTQIMFSRPLYQL